jgi:hypothetical protein
MALPKISAPTFTALIPSNGREIIYRPFLVKEEKNLLIAMESKDPEHMHRAMIEMISNCIISNDIDINKLPAFDVEYLFLKIRSKSVSEKVSLAYRHKDGINYKGESCDAITDVEVDLDQVNIKFSENHSKEIKLSDKLSMKMRYPTLSDIKTGGELDEFEMIAKCIESVYDDEEIYEPDDLNDSKAFLGSLNNQQFMQIAEFFNTMPSLSHEISYTCKKCGQVDNIILKGISDFF